MEIFVVYTSIYAGGDYQTIIEGVYKSRATACACLESVKESSMHRLCQICHERNLCVDADTDDYFSVYDESTGDYSVEVRISTQRLGC